MKKVYDMMQRICSNYAKVLMLVFCAAAVMALTAVPTKAGSGLAVGLDHNQLTLYVGQKKQINMIVGEGPYQAKGWSSSKKSVASVNSKGMVTAKKTGKVTITCNTGFGYNLTCKITVKKRLEVSGYLSKKYTKLAKKVKAAKKTTNDPMGVGNLYVFTDNSGMAPFFRYDLKTKKISFMQIANIVAPEDQAGLTLYGVSLDMKAKAAKKALKAKKWKYVKMSKYATGYDLIYTKSGHTITLKFDDGKVGAIQWNR